MPTAAAKPTDAPAAKRTRKSGPRNPAATHVFARIVDADGQHLPDAKLEVVHQTKDSGAALDFADENKHLTRFRIGGGTKATAASEPLEVAPE